MDQLNRHNIKRCLYYIKLYWFFSCQEDPSYLDLVTNGLFCRKQYCPYDVGYIGVLLAWYTVLNQDLLSHNPALIYLHILSCNSNIL